MSICKGEHSLLSLPEIRVLGAENMLKGQGVMSLGTPIMQLESNGW